MKRIWGTFIYSVMAGFCIGLGGTVFLRLKDLFPGGNVVGAFFFAIGLFAICTRGYALFTGRACYIFDNPWPSIFVELGIIWVGNLLGTMIIAGMERASAISGVEAGVNVTAQALVSAKMETSLLSLFFLGFICNVCIYIAVHGYNNNPHEIGKYLSIFMGVTVFIVCGTEHSIADMYYWAVSGILYEQPARSLLCLVVISLGNVAGGLFLRLGEKWKAKLDEAKQ